MYTNNEIDYEYILTTFRMYLSFLSMSGLCQDFTEFKLGYLKCAICKQYVTKSIIDPVCEEIIMSLNSSLVIANQESE